MKRLVLLTLFIFLLGGCTTATNHVPYTSAEKHLYKHGFLENPQEACELGYQKIYYVVKNQSEQGGNAVLTMSNCLSPQHIAQLKELSTLPPEMRVIGTEDSAVEIVDAFRMPPPDLSHTGFSQGQPIEERLEVTAESAD